MWPEQSEGWTDARDEFREGGQEGPPRKGFQAMVWSLDFILDHKMFEEGVE